VSLNRPRASCPGSVLGAAPLAPRIATSSEKALFLYCNQNARDMIKSNIPNGQMFIQFPKPIPELQDNPEPKVWVKVASETIDGEEVSLFADNNAVARIAAGSLKKFGIRDRWYITDKYYNANVENGAFVPIDDLNEVDGICLERGYPKYEIDL